MKSFDGKLYWQLMSKNILSRLVFKKNILLLKLGNWEDGRRIKREQIQVCRQKNLLGNPNMYIVH